MKAAEIWQDWEQRIILFDGERQIIITGTEDTSTVYRSEYAFDEAGTVQPGTEPGCDACFIVREHSNDYHYAQRRAYLAANN